MQNHLKQFLGNLRTRFVRSEQHETDLALIFEKFRRLLTSNNHSLEIIADLGEKLGGDYIFDKHYIETGIERLADFVKTSIDNLNELCHNRFENLYPVYDRLTAELRRMLAGQEDCNGPQVLALDAIHFLDWEIVGGKGARLAEMAREPSLRVPDGFVITTPAYHDIIDHNNLRPILESFQKLVSDPAADDLRLEEYRRKLEEGVLQASPPAGLLDQLEASLTHLNQDDGSPLFLAIRSSAQEEDMDYSFAGQFQSIINIKATVPDIFSAYCKVAASLFSSEAVAYCRQVMPNGWQMSIAVVCQRMVKARSSGVAFSLDTTAPDKNTMVIVGGWGLGDYIVEGNSPTDTFILSKGKEPEIVERSVTVKPLGRYQADTGGLETRKIEPSRRNHPCLSDPEIIELGKTVKQLELFFKKPQDVEWSVDECGTLHILQARPLAVAKEALLTRTEVLMETLSGYEQICNLQGRVAQQGIASGPVFIVNGPADLVDFPDGAILVSRLDSSHYVKVMKRAAAIVTEIGTPVSHMATLCREMHVPCLVNVGSILNRVTNGEQITVDAEDRVVYRGRVHELLAYSSTSTMQVSYTYEYRLLRRLLKKIATLNLIDPLLQNFTVDGCRTYHDILRFVHETAVMELVSLGRDEKKLLQGKLARTMDLPIPAGIMVIDIGGGLNKNAPAHDVKYTDIESIPFRAILQGMMFPGVWHFEAMKVCMRDLVCSMLSAPNAALSGQYSGHNIAIISREYVNLCFRLGYHFNIIDAHCSKNERDNHIYFRFLGGASDITKRSRRAVMIASILQSFDFNVRTKGDMVVARSGNMVPQEMERTLDILGRLVGFTRQLDVRLDSDETVEQFVEAFLYGNYSLVTDQLVVM